MYILKMLLSRFRDDLMIEIGIDEAGRGSFWGPIMAGAMIIPSETEWTNKQKELFEVLRDSKKITPKKREKLYNLIMEHIQLKGIGVVSSSEINENGISWANQEAFRRAINTIHEIDNSINLNNSRLIIDGVLSISEWTGEQQLIIEGDGKYIAIAGASILAKVAHDRWITEYCKEHSECAEQYDLEKSKGYGTTKHRDGIKIYGAHSLHRTLYIQNWLPGTEPIVKKQRRNKKGTGTSAEVCLIKFN